MEIKNGVLIDVDISDIHNGQFVFPGDVTEIADGAFECCNGLTSISIPENITCIGNDAFTGCKALSSIYIDASSKEHYDAILAMLPSDMQQTIHSNFKSFTEKAVTLLAIRNHDAGFFKQNRIPKDTITELLINLARQYGIPPCMINQASPKFTIDAEVTSEEEHRRGFEN